MALNKKLGSGFDLEERLQGVENVDDLTSTRTLTSTPTYTPTSKENKTKRLYATVKPSTFQKLDAYARAHEDSVNNLVNDILERFIEREGL